MTQEYLLAFNSTHHAIAAEQVLKQKGYPVQMIPTPREVTASCGLSLRWDAAAIAGVDGMLILLQNRKVAWAGFYVRYREAGKTSRWLPADNEEIAAQEDNA